MIAIFPEIQACVESQNSEKLAVLVRKYFGGKDAKLPALDIDELMRDSGIIVQALEVPYFGAIVVKDQAGTCRTGFIVKKSLTGFERSFLLAHCLGRFLFEIQPRIAKGDISTLGYKEQESPLLRYQENRSGAAHERLADAFAAALHMPKGMFVKAWAHLQSEEKIARLFGTTVSSVVQRAAGLAGPTPAPVTQPTEPAAPAIPSRRLKVTKDPLKRIRQLAKKLDDNVKL